MLSTRTNQELTVFRISGVSELRTVSDEINHPICDAPPAIARGVDNGSGRKETSLLLDGLCDDLRWLETRQHDHGR